MNISRELQSRFEINLYNSNGLDSIEDRINVKHCSFFSEKNAFIFFLIFILSSRKNSKKDLLLDTTALHHFLLFLPLELLFGLLLFTDLGFFGDAFFSFGEDHLDVTRMRHEWVDATVGSETSPPVFGSFVHCDMFDMNNF